VGSANGDTPTVSVAIFVDLGAKGLKVTVAPPKILSNQILSFLKNLSKVSKIKS